MHCELQVSKRLHLVTVARASVDRFSRGQVDGTQAEALDCQLQVKTWKESTCPGMRWIAVTASTQGPLGCEKVTLIGSRFEGRL